LKLEPVNKPVLVVAAALAVLMTGCPLRPSGDDVAASVDGQKIYRADLEKYYQSQTAGSSQPLSDDQATGLRLNILRELIENEILMHRAEKLGLLATDEEVERKLNEIKSPYTAEQFNQHLQEEKRALDDLKRDIRRALTAEKVVHKEVTSKINITQQDITDYYNAHRAEFNLIEPRYHLAKIEVTGRPDPQSGVSNKARNEGEARKKIETVLTRLEAGEDFASLAMAYSEDPNTAPNGGDLGIVQESALKQPQIDPRIRETVLKMKSGQYSPIIPTLVSPANREAGSFLILKLIAMEPAGQRDLSDPRVEQEIRQQLQDRREQLLKTAYFEIMRNQARVENYYADKVLASASSSKP
jgi:peptidyl-prolyl cis-trans isomerase SurA